MVQTVYRVLRSLDRSQRRRLDSSRKRAKQRALLAVKVG